MTVTVTRKGQVTIPKQVRDRLGINPGSKVDFEVAEDGRAFLRRVGKRAVKPSRFALEHLFDGARDNDRPDNEDELLVE